MNRFLFNRSSLLEIYNKRNIIIKNLTEEIDLNDITKRNYGESYYNHLNLLLSDIQNNLKNSLPRDENVLPFPPSYEFVKTNFDFSMAVSGIDMTTIHSLGFFEPAETVLAQRIAKYSKTLFDIGANLGYFSFLFKKFAEPGSRVYAFEPENYNYERFEAAIRKNELSDGIEPFKIALSDQNGEEILFINKRGSGGHALIKLQPEIFTEKSESINTRTLDSFIIENNIVGEDSFVKIDVEGAESKILNGAFKFLLSGMPMAILCEIWAEDKTNSELHFQTIENIISSGYSGFSIQLPSINQPLIKPIFEDGRFIQSYNDNYIFVRNDRSDLINDCLEPLKWFELASNESINDLVSIQEKSLLSLIEHHTQIVPKEKSNYYKHYISASDGGFPLIKSNDPISVAAKIRFHHNCGGPAILTLIEKELLEPAATVIVGESLNYRNTTGHYSVPVEESTRIVMDDLLKYRPDVVLLMPNNVTTFNKEELETLRKAYPFYLVARDGDPCSYQFERIEKNLRIAQIVDRFISVDGEFVELAQSRGFNNVEYLPSFVNKHLIPNNTTEKVYDILFTGVGWVGELMDNDETMYKRRRRFIGKVNEKYGDSLKVYGHCWDDMNLANWTNDFISEDLIHQISGKTKIIIGFDGPYAKGFTSVRVFRAMMSGSFVLMRYFPGIENIFENFKHLVWFHGDEEGLQYLEYYLNNDSEREKIAWMGKEYLLSQRGWRRKNIIVDYLLEKANGNKASFGELFGTFDIPKNIGSDILKQKIEILRTVKPHVVLNDVVTYSETMLEQNQIDEAVQILESVIEYDKNNLAALNDLAVIYIMKEQIDKSILFIARVLTIECDNATALNNANYLVETYNEINIAERLNEEIDKIKANNELKQKTNLSFWKELQKKEYFEIHPQGRGLELFGDDLEIISEFITLEKNMNVVVIGCGYGRDSVLIAPNVNQVYGIDVNEHVIAKANKFTADHNVFNFQGVLADEYFRVIPPDIDLVFSHAVFQHMSRNLVWDYIEILKRKLKPNGKFLCRFLEEENGSNDARYDVFEPNVSWSVKDIEQLINTNNLKKIRIKTVREDRVELHYAFFSV